MANHLRFEACDSRRAGCRLGARISGELGKVEPGRPCLGEGRHRGPREAGKVLYAVDVAELGGQRFCDRGL